MISFNCDDCSQNYRVADDKAGKQTTCARCKAKLTVPSVPHEEVVLDASDMACPLNKDADSSWLPKRETTSLAPVSMVPSPISDPKLALVPCKECGAEVSPRALACPRCGVPRPGTEVGKLQIIRSSGLTGAMYAVRVEIDGEFMGELRNGGSLSLDLPVGCRIVEVSGGGMSRKVSVEVRDGKTARFELYFSAWGILGGGLNLNPA
jgi:DNA-directed RNA polymerase subunit RPC12/RpoP